MDRCQDYHCPRSGYNSHMWRRWRRQTAVWWQYHCLLPTTKAGEVQKPDIEIERVDMAVGTLFIWYEWGPWLKGRGLYCIIPGTVRLMIHKYPNYDRYESFYYTIKDMIQWPTTYGLRRMTRCDYGKEKEQDKATYMQDVTSCREDRTHQRR